MKKKANSQGPTPSRSQKKPKITFPAIRILKILKEQTNENSDLSLDELTSKVYKHIFPDWKRAGAKARYDARLTIINNLLGLKESFGEDFPVEVIYTIDKNGNEIIDSANSRVYYKQEFDQNDMNLILASLLQSSTIDLMKIKELINKISSLSYIYEPGMICKLEDLYLPLKNTKKAKSKNSIENNLLKNLKQLIFSMTLEHEGKLRKIEFDYCHLNKDGERIPNKERKYKLSPVYLTFEDGRFWLIGLTDYNPTEYSRYAVDRMKNIKELETEEVINIALTVPDHKKTDEDYVLQHMGASYGSTEPIIIKLLNTQTAYDLIYDTFGTNFKWKDPENGCDRIEVTQTPYGIIKWALANSRDVVIETESVRKMLIETELSKLRILYDS